MDKRRLHHLWTKVRAVKPWYFLIMTAISGAVCMYALRANNLEMARLRDAVFAADKTNGNVQETLQNLQIYVTSHMNTDLSGGPNAPYPPIQLKYTYDHLVVAAGEATSAANSKIYNDAQHYCEKQDPIDFYGRYRVPCIQQYIKNHGVAIPPTIPDSLYKFNFLSPTWSPDLAGWSMLVVALSLFIFIVLWISQRWLRRQTK